jgi:competence protein ComEA
MKTWHLFFLGILIGLLFGGGVFLIAFPVRQSSISYISPTQIESVTVSISGEVKNPGVYTLSIDSRIDDVIRLAGGTLENADLSKLPLAKIIDDEENIEVPAKLTEVNKIQEDSEKKIDLNQATLEELESLPGIGEEKAQAIIDFRNQYGNYSTIEDLMSVPGIGTGLYNSIKTMIEVE